MSGELAPAAPQRSVVQSRGLELALWTWHPAESVKGTVVVFHGLGAHARFPSVALAAELLVQKSYRVCAVDFPGHGESPGMRGYIESADTLIADGISSVKAALKNDDVRGGSAVAEPDKTPLFLLGSSMGGAIAVEVATGLAAMDIQVAGLVLLAPMLGPAADAPARLLLGALAWTPLAPLALIPSSASDNSKQYGCHDVRQSIEADTLAYKGNLRVAAVAAVLDLGNRVESNLEQVTAPFFCLLAKNEMVLGYVTFSYKLLRVAVTPAEHRLCKTYDAFHGILCEPLAKRQLIAADIAEWLAARSNPAAAEAAAAAAAAHL
eukprot:gene8659-32798_t